MAYGKDGSFYFSSYDKAWLAKTIYENPYIPFKPYPKQAEMLCAHEREIALLGTGGSGKSTVLLMFALQFAEETEYTYNTIIARRTLTDLERPGALLDKFKNVLLRPEIQDNPKLRVKYNDAKKVFTFPSGNTISFGYLKDSTSLNTFQGAEFQQIIIDELSQLEKFKYTYMLSRIRKDKDNPLPLRLISASNPGNIGNIWVRERFLERSDKSVTNYESIKAFEGSYEDNIYLNREEYELFLNELDPVAREQLMHGNWYARIEGELFNETDFILLSPERFEKVPVIHEARSWDLAATEVIDENKSSDPDWTAGVKIAEDNAGNLYITKVDKFRLESRKLMDAVLEIAIRDSCDMEQLQLDSATGKNFGLLLLDEWKRHNVTCRNVTSQQNKVDSAREVSAIIQRKPVYIVANITDKWYLEFIEEITSFPNKAVHDDTVDAFCDCYKYFLKRKSPRKKINVDKWYLT